MEAMIDALKQWLRDRKPNYVDHNSWLGDTESGFYTEDEFDINKLMEEIDAFAADFQAKRDAKKDAP